MHSVLVTDEVIYLTLCDQEYPVRLAFAYLSDLQKEFDAVHGRQVAGARHVYNFQKFGISLSLPVSSLCLCIIHLTLCVCVCV